MSVRTESEPPIVLRSRPSWSNFEAVAEFLGEKFIEALARDVPWPDDADSALNQLVYSYVRYGLKRPGKIEKLKAFVETRYGAQRGSGSDNPFLWGLRLVDGNDERWAKFGKQRRSRIGWVMRDAHEHNVSHKNYPLFAKNVGSWKASRDRIVGGGPMHTWAAALRPRPKKRSTRE